MQPTDKVAPKADESPPLLIVRHRRLMALFAARGGAAFIAICLDALFFNVLVKPGQVEGWELLSLALTIEAPGSPQSELAEVLCRTLQGLYCCEGCARLGVLSERV